MTVEEPRLGSPVTPSLEDITISAAQAQPSLITISNTVNKPIVTIRPDGRLEFGEGYQPDEAARVFWDAVQRLTPSPMIQEFGASLTARINAELAAGQRAQKQVERIDSMAAHWLERLPDTIRTAAAVEAIHMVTREGGA